MDALLSFSEYIVQAILTILVWLVIAYALMSWLISFQIINTRNPMVWRVVRALERIVTPMLAPFRRVLPSMAGLDFSPVLFLIVVIGVQRYLVPALFSWLHGLLGSPLVV